MRTSTLSNVLAGLAVAQGIAAADKLKWLGINLSVAEFGQGTYPGTWGKDFYFPDATAVSTLISEGYNIFRVAFSMERLVLDSPDGTLSDAYLANLTETVNHITESGSYAILDPHNFGRYNDEVITDTGAFGKFWTTVADAFKSNENVLFDTNNEYHDMDQDLVLQLNQAAIDAIRGAGATSQYILAEGNSWSGAHAWNVTNDNLSQLSDPSGKLIYEMHQYLDSDNSGTSDACVSGTVGVDRLVGATEWLRENGALGILGEFAGGPNDDCRAAVEGLLEHLQENSDVWQGALWWAAGPWWADYFFSFEPPSGTGYSYYNDLLKSYAP
ncbi:endoglucanase [Poronia punctata]|nr:endoglucanase [Poronia punctata]